MSNTNDLIMAIAARDSSQFFKALETYSPAEGEKDFDQAEIYYLMMDLIEAEDENLVSHSAAILLGMHDFNERNKVEFFKIRENGNPHIAGVSRVLDKIVTTSKLGKGIKSYLERVSDISSPSAFYSWEVQEMSTGKVYPSIQKNRLRKLKNITSVSIPKPDLPLLDKSNPQAMIWNAYKVMAGLEKYNGDYVDDRIVAVVEAILNSAQEPKIVFLKGKDSKGSGFTKQNLIVVNCDNMGGLLVTALHEMVHYADFLVGDGANYLSGICEITNAEELNNLKTKSPKILKEIFDNCVESEIPQELLSHVFEMILVEKDEAIKFLREQAPTLLKFIDEQFIPRCQNCAEISGGTPWRVKPKEKEYLDGNLSDGLYDDEEFVFEKEVYEIPKDVPKLADSGAGADIDEVVELPEVDEGDAVEDSAEVTELDADDERSEGEDEVLLPDVDEDDAITAASGVASSVSVAPILKVPEKVPGK